MIKEIKAYYRLLDTKSIGIMTALKIIQLLGAPTDYVGKKSKKWDSINFVSPEAKSILQKDIDPPNWEKIINFIEGSHNFHFISFLNEKYPEQLKNIYNPPLFITAFGDISVLKSNEIIGIVGTRKPTHYGRKITERITQSLANNNFITVSGLALGIDTCVHKSTLDAGGITIASIATGLDVIYPEQNKDLARRIIEKGCIIAENLPFTQLEKFHFTQRNRIVSGLSKAIVVIEGKKTSGSLITAKFAIEQNRDVFALPGDIVKYESDAPNWLIKQGAKLIATPDDVANEYKQEINIVEKKKIVALTDEEELIYGIIKNNYPQVHLDQILAETGFAYGKLAEILFMLEHKDLIKQIDSAKYSIL
jgi:DNA processing protein